MRVSKKRITEIAGVLRNPKTDIFFDRSAITDRIRVYEEGASVKHFNSNRKAYDYLTARLSEEVKAINDKET